MNAIDTNVLLYCVDKDEPVKQQKAATLLADLARHGAETLLLGQVAVEFGAGLTRWMNLGKISASDRITYFSAAAAPLTYVQPSSNLVPVAFELSVRHSLSYWDSLLLAACIEANVDRLYSEDLSNGATYDGVAIVNPFV